MPECPHCRPLLDESARWATRKIDLTIQTDALLAERANELARMQQKISDAWTHWRSMYSLYLEARAVVRALQAAVDAGGLHPDLSLTPKAGWIAHQIPNGPTIYLRNAEAAQYISGALMAGGALAQLPAAQATLAAALADSIAAVDAIKAAENAWDTLVEAWQARLQAHYDSINAAAANERDFYQQYLACMQACRDDSERTSSLAVLIAAILAFGGASLLFTAGGNTAAGSYQTGPPDLHAASPFGDVEFADPPVDESTAVSETEVVVEDPEPVVASISAGCSGTDHSGTNQVVDQRTGTTVRSASIQYLGWWAPGLAPGTIVVVTVDGPGGEREADGVVGPGGFVIVDVPLFDYGTHTITGVTTDAATPTTYDGPSTFAVNSNQADCDEQTAGPPPEPPTTPTPPPTAAPTATAPPSSTLPGVGGGGGGSSAGGSFDPPPPTKPGNNGTITGTPPPPSGGGDPSGGSSDTTKTAGTAAILAGATLLGTAVARREDETVENPAPTPSPTAEPPGPTETTITINTGTANTTLNTYQPFQIEIQIPRGSEPPPDVITVDIAASSGDDESITLKWDGNVSGPARYLSQTSTLEGGGEGEDSVTVAGFEFTTGGFDSLWIDNGETITFSYGGASTSLVAYDSWTQQGIGQSMEIVRRYDTFARTLLGEIASLDDSDQVLKARNWANSIIRFTELATRSFNSDNLDTTKVAVISTYASMLPRVGVSDMRVLLDEAARFARHKIERYNSQVITTFATDATIGLYRTIVEATPAASAWTLFTGTDIMGHDVTWDAQLLAALELAGWVSLAGGLEARAFASTLTGEGRAATALARGADAADDLPTRPRNAPDVPSPSRTSPGAIDDAILRSPAGTAVGDLRPFGMLQPAADHFRAVATRFALRIRVRAANASSLRWMDAGHPPKHVKLKSKTINDVDVLLGAPEGSQGLVGYFRPTLPSNIDDLAEDLASRVRGRYNQRLNEYADNFDDMQALRDKGLISVDDGVVVDRGLSSTRLGPDGQLHPTGADAAGTGRGFTGDHDMWDITNPDGSVITSPDGLARKAAAERELATGPANTQHGPHKDWVPSGERDLGIDAKIRASHGGEALPDGTIGPRITTNADGTTNATEALIEFKPGQAPVTSYEMGDGQ